MVKRIHSIDALRAIAVLFVAVAHAHPFEGLGTYGNTVFFVLDTIGQFDVPFFFAASGYFLATKIDPGTIRSYLIGVFRKLGSLYLFGGLLFLPAWAVLTLTSATIAGRNGSHALVDGLFARFSPLSVIYYGTALGYHLWFLTALAFSIGFVALFVVFERTRYLLPVATVFYAVGVVGQNYPMLFDVPVSTRDALFFGFFYVALGFTLRTSDWTPDRDRSRYYLGAFALLVVVQLLEQYVVGYVLRDATLAGGAYVTEYTATTALLVFALFVWALSAPDWGRGTVLPDLGEYAVGVYLVHVPVVMAFRGGAELLAVTTGFDPASTIAYHLLVTPVVYAVVLGVYLLADRVGVIDIGGSHVPRWSRIRARIGGDSGRTSLSD